MQKISTMRRTGNRILKSKRLTEESDAFRTRESAKSRLRRHRPVRYKSLQP